MGRIMGNHVKIKLSAYAGTSENPAVLVHVIGVSYRDGMCSENLTGADNQQVGQPCAAYPNDHNESPVAMQRVMEWSELHGDMQTEAEMASGRQFRP